MALTENNIKESFHRALHCWGTAKVTENRLKRLVRYSNISKILGLGVPLFVGGTILSFGDCALWSNSMVKLIFGILALTQLIFSLVAIVYNLDKKIVDYSESKVNNLYYYDVFYDIFCKHTDDEAKYESIYNDFILRDDQQRKNDNCKFNFSSKELRYGYRHGLLQLKTKCPVCKKYPDIKKPSKTCSACGM